MLSVPEMGDRYWLMQLIDAWNNVPHVPGTRTLGGKGGDFAIVGPGWTGELPDGRERAADAHQPGDHRRTHVRLRARTDYPAVHALQDQYRLVPLEAWGSDWAPPAEVPVAAGRRHQDAGTAAGAGDDARDVLRTAQRAAARQPALPGGRAGDGAHRRAGDRARRRVSVGELRARRAAGDHRGGRGRQAGHPRAGGASRRARQRLAGRRSTWAATGPATPTAPPGRSSASAAT